MKKLSYFSTILAIAFTLGLVSCSDDSNNSDEPVSPETPSSSEAMSPLKQKEYMETVALEFMDKTPASDFESIANLLEYLSNTYGEYDWDNIVEWGEDVLDDATEAIGTTTTDQEEYYGDVYNYYYNNYKCLILASNFTGHFTAQNGKWNYTNANDLRFIFKDSLGKECVLKVIPSGNVKKVYLFNIDDWYDYEYDYINGDYIYYDYYNRTQYTIGMPEKIEVILTQGGNEVIKNTVNIDLSNIVDEEFDLSKSDVSASATIKLNNGYEFVASQVVYDANAKASVVLKISKGNSALLTISAASDLSGIPSCNVSAFTSDVNFNDNYNFDNVSAKNTYLKFDILGKVQMQGVISDVNKFVEYLDEANNNDDNESRYKSYLNQANGLMNINLFYDGSAIKQASITFEAFEDGIWGGKTYWTYEPIINFYDGSSYSTFEAFFNDIDFKNVINAFENLVEKYENICD